MICTRVRKDSSCMVWLACAAGRTDGRTDGQTDGRTDRRTDGRTCNDIVLSRHDLKTYFEQYFREFERILHLHVWFGLRAPLDGRTRGRTDGRTCNDIVLSRHDRKKIFVIFFPENRKILQVPVLGIFSEISLST